VGGVVVDAFHGAGGWSEALDALRVQVDALRAVAHRGIELDPDMVATARAAGHDAHQGDVATNDPHELTEGEECVGLIASPPCPSFSIAGKKHGLGDLPLVRSLVHELAEGIDNRAAARPADPRSLLSAEPMRWVHALEPEWVALEQVPTVLPVWQDMATILRRRGYSAWCGVLNAECYGAPQTRQRAILLASRSHRVGEPEATHRRYYTPRQRAAYDPPDAHLPLWRSMADATGWAPEDLIGFARRNDRDDGLTHRARDLRHASLPAFALTEKARSWMRVHEGETLRVSIDDAAVLQGFRRGYPWQGSRSKQFAQCANAIPVDLARAVLADVACAQPLACAA
jgi:DNA (cytosine-5)-methyltransferase 1